MMTTYKHLLLSLLFCSFYYSGFNQIIYVNQQMLTGNHDGTSWENAFLAIQDALTTANAGTQIWVAQGTYFPTQNLDKTISFNLKEGVEMYGGFVGIESSLEDRNWQAYPTILSGDLLQNDAEDFTNMEDNTYCVIYSEHLSEATILDGFTVSGGYANHPTASSQSLGQSGGAWFNRGSFGVSNPTVRHCTFTNNQANSYGGVLYNNGGFNGQTNMVFEDCHFVHNRSRDSGGGIYNQGNFGGESSPTFSHCTFRDNVSEGSGGLFFNNGTNGISNPVYINCIFSDNHSENYGGVAFNMGKDFGDCSPVFINCLFIRNKALSAGVMYNLGSEEGQSNPHLINCTLYDNFGAVSAGTLNNNGGESEDLGLSHARVDNCVFWNNRTAGIGAVFKNNNGSVNVKNCLISAVDCVTLNVGTGSIIHCDTTNIFNQYPMFVDTMNGDFSLLPMSIAKNHGDNNSLPIHITEDLAGQQRILEDTIDIGAYEIFTDGNLPIHLVAFTATLNQRNQVELSWQTASEEHADFFMVERSTNADFFITIEKISALGKTAQPQQYAALDSPTEKGILYYRLKMVDQDGKFEYSPMQTVKIKAEKPVLSIYPNPNKGKFSIDFLPEITTLERVEVYNSVGSLVYKNDTLGQMNVVDLTGLEGGIYWIIFKVEGEIFRDRVVVSVR